MRNSISHYEILEKVGAGGMGEVYRALDSRLNREVAVKVLPPHLAKDPAALARFEREARSIASLAHPNILGIFDVGKDDGIAFTVTELLKGGTLRERLDGGPLPVRKAVDCAVQLAQGLAAVHEEGIIHRDLKPENIFLTRDGRLKILDFGLAKQEPASGGTAEADMPTLASPSNPGSLIGTILYMAPEQVRGQRVDHRADIFAFGVVLYEMLSGRRAFQLETTAETMTAILHQDPPDLATLNPQIPPGLIRIAEHCLEKKPDERFQSASDVAFALQTLSGISSGESKPLSNPSSRRRLRFIRASLIFLGCLGILSAFLSGAYFGRLSGVPPSVFQQMTFQPQAIFRALFAPDGQTVIYSAALDGNNPDLFILRPEYPEPKPLGLRKTHLLAISSKGELLVLTNARYVAHRFFRGTLARVRLGGSAPREILENVREADWSPDGSELALIRNVDGLDRLEFPAGKVLFQSAGYLSDLRISPRGDQVALFEHQSRYDDRGWVILVDRLGRRRVLDGEFTGEQGLAWSPRGDEVFFSAANESLNLVVRRVDLQGRSRVALAAAGRMIVQDVSPTGQWLITREDFRYGIKGLAPGASEERDLSWLDFSADPRLSQDGNHLLFTEYAERTGHNYTVCWRRTEGSPVVQLGEGWAGDLSPDGRWALGGLSSPPQLVVYPTGAGKKRILERGKIERYHWASWFPDGKRVLFGGNEPGKKARCYAQDLEAGPPHPVTPEGEYGFVSPDGKQVVVSRHERTPVIFRLEGQNPLAVPIPQVTDEDRPVRWSSDGRSIYFSRHRQVPGRIERIDLVTGSRVLVHEYATSDRIGLLSCPLVDVAADPRIYAYRYDRRISTLFLVKGER